MSGAYHSGTSAGGKEGGGAKNTAGVDDACGARLEDFTVQVQVPAARGRRDRATRCGGVDDAQGAAVGSRGPVLEAREEGAMEALCCVGFDEGSGHMGL